MPDLQQFQHATALLALGRDPDRIRETAVLVPTAGAAEEFRHTLEDLAIVEGWRPSPGDLDRLGVAWPFAAEGEGPLAFVLPHLVTRAGLYELLGERLAEPCRSAGPIEREVLMQDAARRAAEAGSPPPFAVRPALVAEMLAFVDALGRNRRTIEDFERLVGGPLEAGASIDRGARRLLQQTVFLAAAFREYNDALERAGLLDEAELRERLLIEAPGRPLRHLVVTVPDSSASPHGLWPADYDLLTRVDGLASIDVVATEATLGAGYLPRLLDALPEIEVVSLGGGSTRAPQLLIPEGRQGALFVSRDREDELADFATRLSARPLTAGSRAAVVYQRPLPYLALARQVFGAAGVTWQALDARPLGSEPYAAAIDLVLTFVTTACSRSAGIALLRAPQFRIRSDGTEPTRESIAAADRALAEAFFLGGRDGLQELHDRWAGEAALDDSATGRRAEPRAGHARRTRQTALPAMAALLDAAARLAPLEEIAAPSAHLAVLGAFLREIDREPGDANLGERHARGRAAVLGIVDELRRACLSHGDSPRPFADLAVLLRGLIEEHTFNPRVGPGVVALVDASAAPYGRYQDVTLVGLTESEWPEATARSIFYPVGLLRGLGWPSETDRRAAARAAFDDLVRLATRAVTLSTFLLEDDAIVRPSAFVEDVPRTGLTTCIVAAADVAGAPPLALEPPPAAQRAGLDAWRSIRAARAPIDPLAPVGSLAAAAYAVTSLDRYRECPFKYFAAQVLRLDEEREDHPGLSPQERGAFVHDVFHAFFARWGAAGRGTIELASFEDARRLFAEVVDEWLEALPESERPLERARLIGSAAGSGIGERVFRFEAARPLPIVERLLEVSVSGDHAIADGQRTRRVRLRGTADRVDLIADGTMRLVDYKTGKASAARKSLQVPVYAICAEQHLKGHKGRAWRVAEAGYLAFGREEPYASVLTEDNRDTVLPSAASALIDAVDAIERGAFPVAPEEPHLCTFCGFAAVCRKDYVEDE